MRVRLLLVFVMCISIGLSGCAIRSPITKVSTAAGTPNSAGAADDKALTPTPGNELRAIAVNCDRAAGALNSLVDLKRVLLANGVIKKEKSNAISTVLLKSLRSARALADAGRESQSFVEGKTKLGELFAAYASDAAAVAGEFAVVPGMDSGIGKKVGDAIGKVTDVAKKLGPLFQ